MTDATLLRMVGETLYGEPWKAILADALGVSNRTLRRWLAGQNVPEGVWLEFMALKFRQRVRIASVNDAVVNKVESLAHSAALPSQG